jgi:single-strand DNA-binding protein
MATVNKVIILGHLGKDPETKTARSGKTVATFSVATSDPRQDKDGQWQEETDWHRIVAFGQAAEFCGKRLHKGSLAYIEGKSKTRSWEDRNGQKRYVTEIIAKEVKCLDPKQQNDGERQGNSRKASGNSGGGGGDDYDGNYDDYDQIQNPDDIPF